MRRREFLTFGLALPALSGQRQRDDADSTVSRYIVSRMFQKARAEGWVALPMGELMCRFGELLLGTLYATGTLESPDGEERCRVDLTRVDCFTFVEAVLCLARTLKRGTSTFEGFLAEVCWTRYRDGRQGDYTTRLHYTADWLYDNERRGVLRNITPQLGGKPLQLQLSYMSTHAEQYSALRQRPELVERIAEIERAISLRPHWYIPKREVAAILPQLQPGDILAMTTSRAGLDYGHIGLAYPWKGRLCVLHASQRAGKVIVDAPLPEYLASVATHTGITVARALVPS